MSKDKLNKLLNQSINISFLCHLFILICFDNFNIYFSKINLNLPIILIALCLVGRSLNIGICSYLANIPRSTNSYIGFKKQVNILSNFIYYLYYSNINQLKFNKIKSISFSYGLLE